MVPTERLELPTHWLQISSSTNWATSAINKILNEYFMSLTLASDIVKLYQAGNYYATSELNLLFYREWGQPSSFAFAGSSTAFQILFTVD